MIFFNQCWDLITKIHLQQKSWNDNFGPKVACRFLYSVLAKTWQFLSLKNIKGDKICKKMAHAQKHAQRANFSEWHPSLSHSTRWTSHSYYYKAEKCHQHIFYTLMAKNVKESKDFVIYSKYQIDINRYQIDIKSKSKWYQSIMIWYRSISILLPRGFLGVANTAQIFAIYFTVNFVNNDTNNACQVLQLVRYFSLPGIKT